MTKRQPRPLSTGEIRELLLAPQKQGNDELLIGQGERAIKLAFELMLGTNEEETILATAFLCRAAKRLSSRKVLDQLLEDRTPLTDLLKSPNPKLRKNAARLFGLLGRDTDAALLIDALEAEQQRWVRPSIILSLGSVGGDLARKAVFSLPEPIASDPSEYKHAREERDAISMAKAKLNTNQMHEFTGLKNEAEIQLRTVPNFTQVLSGEADEFGFSAYSVQSDRLTIRSRNYASLFKMRTFHEALFPLCTSVRFLPDDIADAVMEKMLSILAQAHSGVPPYTYRIELKAEVDRGLFSREIAGKLDGNLLLNSPSSYEVELRIEEKNGMCDAYLKLFTFPDKRFDYRLNSLPASIHPATAASILRYAKPFLKPNPRVLDPFAGSGTMLIERAFLSSCRSLTGIDLSAKAVEIARANTSAAEVNAKFVHNDCLRFSARRNYDEILSNMPFGNRVGTHDANIELYSKFIEKMVQWLSEDGVAVLYTMEHILLKKLLAKSKELKLEDTAKAYAGGLLPSIFIVKRRI